ncbi:MAG: LPS export ABC transporter periplasmic protein LptC [Bacteroidetes bacterium 4484_276]|nr:MAG: LPS export ABC transporter periplasmic protein LptC [Bacteroidetes bacterium 4484_276]
MINLIGLFIKNITGTLIKSIVAIFFAIVLFACENDMQTINSLSNNESIPDETATDIEVIYSDSGRIMIKLISAKLNRYETDEPYIEFPEGLRLLFFDSVQNVKSELTANYGIRWEKKKIMEVKDDVVITDFEKDEILNTEHIIWDQAKRKIYSEVFVKRTNKDGVMYGEGFTADENLKNYKLLRPKGVFTVDDEK